MEHQVLHFHSMEEVEGFPNSQNHLVGEEGIQNHSVVVEEETPRVVEEEEVFQKEVEVELFQ